MTSPEYKAWPKTPRLFRDVIITEKMDGTNSAVIIERCDPSEPSDGWVMGLAAVDGCFYRVGAQSRNRIITPNQDGGPSTDHYGFAAWVQENARELVHMLGEGHHYGEWWGSGIANGYGLKNGERYFSLFNVERYLPRISDSGHWLHDQVRTVPILYKGGFDQQTIDNLVNDLRVNGSWAKEAWGEDAEGVIIFHTQSRNVFKVLCENDALPKGVVPREVDGLVPA